MKPLSLIYTHDNIFNGVKMESSLLAERRADTQGNSMFDQLVFDEEYLILFRQLFFDAQSELIPTLSAYIKAMPDEPGYFETQDFAHNRDCILTLLMPDSFMHEMGKVTDIKIKQFIISYIMYRWLETKLTDEAAIYLNRSHACLSDIKGLLEKRTKPVRRKARWF